MNKNIATCEIFPIADYSFTVGEVCDRFQAAFGETPEYCSEIDNSVFDVTVPQDIMDHLESYGVYSCLYKYNGEHWRLRAEMP